MTRMTKEDIREFFVCVGLICFALAAIVVTIMLLYKLGFVMFGVAQ